MKKPTEWDATEAKGFGDDYKRLVPGGYVAKITAAEEVEEKEYFRFEFDITEGEYKGYGAACMERNGFTPLKLIRSYKGKALGMFKGFVTCMEQSNPGKFTWDWTAGCFVGKSVGVVLREEEYRKNDGTVGTRLGVSKTVTPDDIRKGNFRVPDKKKLPEEQAAPAFMPMDDAEDGLPF